MTNIMTKKPRTQAIKYTVKGRAYVTTSALRVYLDEVMRLSPPKVIDGIAYGGAYGISNNTALLIHISADGESARVLWQ